MRQVGIMKTVRSPGDEIAVEVSLSDEVDTRTRADMERSGMGLAGARVLARWCPVCKDLWLCLWVNRA